MISRIHGGTKARETDEEPVASSGWSPSVGKIPDSRSVSLNGDGQTT
jgi:hypothetical protein